jgi:hypothetical protein
MPPVRPASTEKRNAPGAPCAPFSGEGAAASVVARSAVSSRVRRRTSLSKPSPRKETTAGSDDARPPAVSILVVIFTSDLRFLSGYPTDMRAPVGHTYCRLSAASPRWVVGRSLRGPPLLSRQVPRALYFATFLKKRRRESQSGLRRGYTPPGRKSLRPREYPVSGAVRQPRQVVQVSAFGTLERLPAVAIRDEESLLDLAHPAAVADLMHDVHLLEPSGPYSRTVRRQHAAATRPKHRADYAFARSP